MVLGICYTTNNQQCISSTVSDGDIKTTCYKIFGSSGTNGQFSYDLNLITAESGGDDIYMVVVIRMLPQKI